MAATFALLIVGVGCERNASTDAVVPSSLEIYLDEGGRLQQLSSGSLVEASAAVRFLARRTDRLLMVLSLDSQGRVSRFYPPEGPAASPPPHGILPDRVLISDAPGPERIYAIYSDQPFGFDEIADVTRHALSRSRGRDVRSLDRLPIDLPHDSVLLEKTAR